MSDKVIHPVVIVGAGPAGMTAAIYLKRANVPVKLVDKYAPGGKLNITQSIENYPGYTAISGPDLAFKMFEQVRENGMEVDFAEIDDITKDEDGVFTLNSVDGPIYAQFVIIATGTAERKLKIPGEARYTGKGVSYCAVCDGNFYKDLPIAVIGGGNSALEEALFLSKIVGKIYLIHRRQEFRAEEETVTRIKEADNIELVLDTIPTEVVGDGKKVTALKTKNVVNGEERTLEVSAVFPFVGADAQGDMLKNFDVRDERGYVLVNDEMETAVEGLYSAGDINEKSLRQITTAISDGAIAAISVSKKLRSLKKRS
jgi:thioredoxin reductase (NADPH)